MADYRQTFAPQWPSAQRETTPFDALAVDPTNADGPVTGADGLRISDLPFPYPSSDLHRIANAVWLLENNPSGRALLPAMPDDETDAPRFAAVTPSSSSSSIADEILNRARQDGASRPTIDVASPQNGRALLARDIDDVRQVDDAQPSTANNPQSEDYLHFDGSKLRWWGGDGTLKAQWTGMSGLPKFQREQDQSLRDQGPLPAGTWDVRQNEYQTLNLKNELKGTLGGAIGLKLGEWPGGSIAWGDKRVWLKPAEGTNTRGRKDFSIHGGAFPGSAGCIDLTRNMEPLAQMFRDYGKDIKLYVDYGRE